MPRLVVTVNDHAMLPQLRTAIRQLRGVEQVSTLREQTSAIVTPTVSKQHRELLQRIDDLAQLADGWDGTDSKAIDQRSVKNLRRALNRATASQLDGWVLFPEAHGYLYFDYTGKNGSAGITMMPDHLVYFIEKNGKIQKSNGIAFTPSNFLSILNRVNG